MKILYTNATLNNKPVTMLFINIIAVNIWYMIHTSRLVYVEMCIDLVNSKD